MEIKNVCVLGTGEFGQGITQVIAQSGLEVILQEVKDTLTQDLKGIDLVIESLPEDIELKKKIFKEISAICPPDTILATTTSYLSITEMASVTKRADKFIGLNFLHPATETKLVQITRGIVTTNQTYEVCKSFVERIGRVICANVWYSQQG